MVSAKRTCVGHGDFQCRDQRRSNDYAGDCFLDRRPLGLALGICGYWSSWIRLAGALAKAVPATRSASAMHEWRTGVDPRRRCLGAAKNQLGETASSSTDLGGALREVSYRPSLVVLPFLDP